MRILYKQDTRGVKNSVAEKLGIANCYFKEIRQNINYKIATPKEHWHDVYEVHMILCGKQSYYVEDKVFEVCAGDFIIISPKIKHRVTATSNDLIKYSVTFSAYDLCDYSLFVGEIPLFVKESVEFIVEEFVAKKSLSSFMIENRVFETVALLLRASGYKEGSAKTDKDYGDYQLILAEKFIADNIERNLSVSEVAGYCHISTRQLSRIFISAKGLTPANYIRDEKMKQISNYLKNSELTLKQISEKFSYSDEYYFNAAFKKYFGIPPFAYRKMHR